MFNYFKKLKERKEIKDIITKKNKVIKEWSEEFNIAKPKGTLFDMDAGIVELYSDEPNFLIDKENRIKKLVEILNREFGVRDYKIKLGRIRGYKTEPYIERKV